jgi:Sulfotransferase domain
VRSGAGRPPCFVVNTGRCGSTFLSEILLRHPAVLSLSEFLVSMEPDPFPGGEVSGRAFAEMLARIDPVATLALEQREEPVEFRYPVDAGLRFDRRSGVPAVLGIALPSLTGDPDPVFDDLVAFAGSLPAATIESQYTSVFERLRARFGGEIWVERSGGSIQYLPQLLERFPDARYVHLYRDGRETAISMRTRPNFRLMFIGADIERASGVNPFKMVSPPHLDLPEPLARLQPATFDFAAFHRYDVPLERYGLHWSSSELRGLRTFRKVDPDRVLPLAYEDLVGDPRRSLERLAEFLSIEPSEDWIAWSISAASPPAPRWPTLPEPERGRLDAACRIANGRLYGPSGPPGGRAGEPVRRVSGGEAPPAGHTSA